MFSIIIPIYNEQESIKYLIEEIYSSLKEFRDFEIIIVNDFSSDDSLEVLKTINKNIHFKIINNKKNEINNFIYSIDIFSICFLASSNVAVVSGVSSISCEFPDSTSVNIQCILPDSSYE